MKVKYLINVVGFDKNSCRTVYKNKSYDFATLDEAKKQFALIDNNPKDYLDIFQDFGFWAVYLEKHTITEDGIEFIKAISELDIYKEDLCEKN